MGKASEARDDARNKLRGILAPNSTIYTVVTTVARSGMSRRMKVFTLTSDSEGKPWIRTITWLIARALGYRFNERGEDMTVGGCGMDMGFHVANSLSYALHGYPQDFIDPDNVPGYRPGYSIKHEWL